MPISRFRCGLAGWLLWLGLAIPSEGADLKTRNVILITTDDCHFCERAHELLDAFQVPFREVSVDSPEAAVLAAGGLPLPFLPVLTDGERLIAYGRFSEKRLRRELALEGLV